MMAVIPAIVGLVAFWVLWKELTAKSRPKKLSKVAGAAAVALIAALLLLTATGRLPWLAALAAGALPFLRWGLSMAAGPLIGHFLRSGFGAGRFGGFGPFGQSSAQHDAAQPGGATPSVSTVSTADLRMTLEHESGDMDGTVLRGALAGRKLSELAEGELQDLYRALSEPDSVQLLAAYLERRFPGWTADSQRNGGGEQASEMDESQALAVLGLDGAASKEDVLAAHRRLIQRLHPDRGGTDYLAATLNKAKEVLLAR